MEKLTRKNWTVVYKFDELNANIQNDIIESCWQGWDQTTKYEIIKQELENSKYNKNGEEIE